MNMRPPLPGEPRERIAPPRALPAWLPVLLTILCVLLSAWQLFHLPGASLKKLRLPEDMPAYGFGIAGVQVDPAGNWVIRREAYVDRMGRYEINPRGVLTKKRERGLPPENNYTGALSRQYVRMNEHSYLQVKPSRAYFIEQRRLKEQVEKKLGHTIGDPTLRRGETEADYQDPSPPQVAQQAKTSAYVELNIMRAPSKVPVSHLPPILAGHAELQYQLIDGEQYHESIDSAAFVPPDLWLTTQRGRRLHHIHASDVEDQLDVRLLGSADTGITAPLANALSLGHDPGSGRLFLITPDGIRRWYDPLSLKPTGQDKLPGVWAREYGAVTLQPETDRDYQNYALYGGWPLTESAYLRLERILAIVMLAGLGLLALQWRKPWRFISAATTAASSSSSRPSNT